MRDDHEREPSRWSEPCFELPPQIGYVFERRLTGRAAAEWRETRGESAMPLATDYLAAVEPAPLADFGASSIVLAFSASGTFVDAVGLEVARAFGLRCGRLAGAHDDDLAARLTQVIAALAVAPEAVAFDAVLAHSGGGPATLLTRGVLLPLSDAAGRFTAAHVVMTWKETLSPAASDRLRRELAVELGGRPPARSAASARTLGTPWH